AAAAAMDGRPRHEEGRILGRADGVLQRRPEARPTRAAIELRRRGEKVEVAARAGEIAAPMLVEQRARESLLGRALPQHGILLGCQELVPFVIGMGYREGFVGTSCGGPPTG